MTPGSDLVILKGIKGIWIGPSCMGGYNVEITIRRILESHGLSIDST